MRKSRYVDVLREVLRDPTAGNRDNPDAVKQKERELGITEADIKEHTLKRLDKVAAQFHAANRKLGTISSEEVDRQERMEALQTKIFNACVEDYVLRTTDTDTISKRLRGGTSDAVADDERSGAALGGGYAKTRLAVIQKTYAAFKSESLSGIPKEQFQLTGVPGSAIDPSVEPLVSLCMAWKKQRTTARKAAEEEQLKADTSKAATSDHASRPDDADAVAAAKSKTKQQQPNDGAKRSTKAAKSDPMAEEIDAIAKELEKCSASEAAATLPINLKPPVPQAILRLRFKNSHEDDPGSFDYFFLSMILGGSGFAGVRVTPRPASSNDGSAPAQHLDLVLPAPSDLVMLISHKAEHLAHYDLSSAVLCEAVPGLLRNKSSIFFRLAPEPWEAPASVLAEIAAARNSDEFLDDDEEENKERAGKRKQKSAAKQKGKKAKIWAHFSAAAAAESGTSSGAASFGGVSGREQGPASSRHAQPQSNPGVREQQIKEEQEDSGFPVYPNENVCRDPRSDVGGAAHDATQNRLGQAAGGATSGEAASSTNGGDTRGASGKEADPEWRKAERQRIAAFLANKKPSGGSVVPVKLGVHYELKAATRIIQCEMLLPQYWSIFEKATGVATKGASSDHVDAGGDVNLASAIKSRADGGWDTFDSAHFFDAPASSGVKQRGVKQYGDVGATALLTLWAHRAYWLAVRFKSPLPKLTLSSDILDRMRQEWAAFSQAARDECARNNIPKSEIDRFGAIDTEQLVHLRWDFRSRDGRDEVNAGSAADAGAVPVAEVSDEDLAAMRPVAGGDDTAGLEAVNPVEEVDDAGDAEIFDPEIANVDEDGDADAPAAGSGNGKATASQLPRSRNAKK
eukprot:g10988.t1